VQQVTEIHTEAILTQTTSQTASYPMKEEKGGSVQLCHTMFCFSIHNISAMQSTEILDTLEQIYLVLPMEGKG
jgi:hypothetical protein